MQCPLPTGQTLAIDQYGYPAAPAVILLHGLSSNRITYDQVVHHLGVRYVDDAHLQVITVDLRGHGESSRATREAYDAASYAADVAALIEEVAPPGGAIIVGHSLGGVVGAHLAATRPELVQGLFLEDPPIYEDDAARRAVSPAASFFPKLIAAVRDLQGRDAPVEEYRPLAEAMVPPDEVEARCACLHQWDPATMEAAVEGIVWRGFDPDAALACPVTVVRADPAVGAVFEPGDADRFLRANPDAEVIMVPGSSHSVHASATLDAYLRELDVFLINM